VAHQGKHKAYFIRQHNSQFHSANTLSHGVHVGFKVQFLFKSYLEFSVLEELVFYVYIRSTFGNTSWNFRMNQIAIKT